MGTPFVPGSAGAAIKAVRAADKIADLSRAATGTRKVTSSISKSRGLVREAAKLSGAQQRSADGLVTQLLKGNLKPGIGTKAILGGKVLEARAKNGARVFFRENADLSIEILGKSTKANQDKVIELLKGIL